MVGDCWLEAGRFSDAWTSYVRAARHAYVRRDISTLSFQIEGAAASLAGLERREEAFRTLGLADTITPTERPLRDLYPAWSGEVAAHLDPARAAIGDAAADAAYAEGHALPRDRAIEAFFAIQVAKPQSLSATKARARNVPDQRRCERSRPMLETSKRTVESVNSTR